MKGALVCVCVLCGTAGITLADFGCNQHGDGALTGTVCGKLTSGTPPTCDPVCFGATPECWPGVQIQVGSGTKYTECVGGTPTECCEGTNVQCFPCTCACVSCATFGEKPDYCNSCSQNGVPMVLYRTGTCVREGGIPVGCD